MVFKKKETLMNQLRKFNNPILKSKPKELRYTEFLETWSKQFNQWFPVFVGLLAAIFINILTKDISVPPQELFSYLLTSAFILVVLTSLLVSIIATGILYVIIVFIFGSLIYLLHKVTNKIQVRYGSIVILGIILIFVGLGYYITTITKAITGFWVLGLIIESLGVIIALHISSHYLNLFSKKNENKNL